MKHVLIIPSWYKNRFNPLSGSFFVEQAKALSENGFKVGVLAVNLISPKLIFRNRKLPQCYITANTVDRVNEVAIEIPSIRAFNSVAQVVCGRKLFKQYVKKHGLPDVIHVHSYLAAKIAIDIKEKFGIPYVVTEHQSNVGLSKLNANQYSDAKRAYQSANEVIGVSSYLTDVINQAFQVDASTIPNMFDFSLSKIGKNTSGKFRFLSVGSLDKNKNHKDFIKLAFELTKNYECEFHLIGDGPLKEMLENSVSELGLENVVFLHGSCNRETTLRMFSESDCYIHTSQFETFGVVYLEALASGLPVISYDTKGVRDVVNKGNGAIVLDFDELVCKAIDMIKNNSVYSKPLIRQDAEKSFSTLSIVNQLKTIYARVF